MWLYGWEMQMGLMKILNVFNNKAVNALIIKDGKLLVVKRREKEIPWPGMYVMPGGRIEKGESKKEAVIREVKEETGEDVRVNRYIGTRKFYWRYIPFTVSFYTAEIIGGRTRPLKKEVAKIKWLSLDEFLDNLKEHKFPMRGIDKLVDIVKPYF